MFDEENDSSPASSFSETPASAEAEGQAATEQAPDKSGASVYGDAAEAREQNTAQGHQSNAYQSNAEQNTAYQGNAYQRPPYQGNAYQSNAYQSNAYQSNTYQRNNGTANPNGNDQGNGYYSDIRYTYNPNGAGNGTYYNTQSSSQRTQKKKTHGAGVFIVIIAVLLCLTIGATGLSLYNVFKSNNDSSTAEVPQASETPATTVTPDKSGKSAFDSVVELNPTPTPSLVEGQLLTSQQVAQKVMPSVVCIQCYVAQTGYYGSAGTSSLYGQGSGIISSADGYIITNAHVVEGVDSIQIVLYSGAICDAEVIGADSITDIALLKIDPKDQKLTPATFSSIKNCQIADTVIAIGNPGGIDFAFSVTQGIISCVDRTMQDEETGYITHCIQTDTAINPGNSGGPLCDLYGHVIGITSSKIVAQYYENLSFAITYDSAAPIISDLLNYGYVKNRATINVSLSQPSNVFRITGWNTIPSGLCITAISGKAEREAGLEEYDIISAIDGKPIANMTDYSAYLLTKKPGDTVTLSVYHASISGWSIQYASNPVEISIVLSEAT